MIVVLVDVVVAAVAIVSRLSYLTMGERCYLLDLQITNWDLLKSQSFTPTEQNKKKKKKCSIYKLFSKAQPKTIHVPPRKVTTFL